MLRNTQAAIPSAPTEYVPYRASSYLKLSGGEHKEPSPLPSVLPTIKTMIILAYLGSILLLGLAYIIFDTGRNWYRLRHIPGPFSAGFSKWWLFKHTWNGTLYLESAEQCFKYGMCNLNLTTPSGLARLIYWLRLPRPNWPQRPHHQRPGDSEDHGRPPIAIPAVRLVQCSSCRP